MRVTVLVAALALVAVVGFRYVRQTQDEHRWARIASEIAGRKVSVQCQGPLSELVDTSGNSGFVRNESDGRPGDVADLSRPVCRTLGRVVRHRKVTIAAEATAVEVLAHESFHLAGFADEATAECYALQAMPLVASRLGIDDARSRVLLAYSLSRYPRLPDEYVTPDCRNGGPLDLRPQTNAFP